ncbi:MAG: Fe-S cluster assembly ATPase SufC [Bacteroidales bacterium]|nr:Fe-S cluster assembly ATPase SufC [Bacteroidales bacterium]MDD3911444.1 Fe-S cluster assembly ATPase SufC [Bacteroidales bacterium]MDD4420683.1 Fe-S cluster assembly ATPase SufC [Bacteroidales bacterium]
MEKLLEINNLHATISGKEILKGINLVVKPGEIHAIMGPNGSGKSTLSAVLAGNENYIVTDGTVKFMGKNLLEMKPEERSWAGIFLGFQYPVEIPGVTNVNFMKTAVNEHRKEKNLPALSAAEYLKMMREKMAIVQMDPSFSSRGVNVGFSGGEKKRNEIFQMAMLDPALAILDETDSGLDVDALRIVANGVNKLKTNDNAFIIITHYQRLLDYIIPDIVHVLYKGKIIKTAGKELAHVVETKGYDEMIKEQEENG